MREGEPAENASLRLASMAFSSFEVDGRSDPALVNRDLLSTSLPRRPLLRLVRRHQ